MHILPYGGSDRTQHTLNGVRSLTTIRDLVDPSQTASLSNSDAVDPALRPSTPWSLFPEPQFTPNALEVLQQRYLRRDADNKVVETPAEMLYRVAYAISEAELLLGGTAEARRNYGQAFYKLMARLDFLPNSPTLFNAGTKNCYSACFVIPLADDMDAICDARKEACRVVKAGGGFGMDFSPLRPRGSNIASTHRGACGPIANMIDVNQLGDTFTQQGVGAVRKAAMMFQLRVDHPDVLEFIHCKDGGNVIANANISVNITNAFMDALTGRGSEDYHFDLVWNNEIVRTVDARDLWQQIAESAWKTGDPGLFFVDRVNGPANPISHIAPISATNPCIPGSERVYTASGMRCVRDLYEAKHTVPLIINRDQHIADAVPFFRTGCKPVFRLETREGYTLRLTADHRVSTPRGMIAAKDLCEGDRIYLLHHKGGFGLHGSEAIGRVLGWFVGDGCFSESDGRAILDFYGEKKLLAQSFTDSVNSLVAVMIGTSTSYRPIAAMPMSEKDGIRFRSARLTELLADFDITPATKLCVPERVFTGSETMQRGYLQALFTADGTVNAVGKKGGTTVRLTSTSFDLLRDVQRLLLNFGIASRIYQNRRLAQMRWLPDGKGGKALYPTQAYHDLSISKSNLRVFLDEIGFLLSSKQEKAEHELANYQHGLHTEGFTARFLRLDPDGEEEVFDTTVPGVGHFICSGLEISNCGEVPLLPYESCNLGSINLSNFAIPETRQFDWDRLTTCVRLATRFLDDVVTVNHMPSDATHTANLRSRRIGLGVMGLADALALLQIPYDSDEGISFGRTVMQFIQDVADKTSLDLGRERGCYEAWAGSDHERQGQPYRNAFRTVIAPTGSISILAGCSSGIEPYFALEWSHTMETGTKLPVRALGYTHWLNSPAQHPQNGSTPLPRYLQTAQDIDPVWHVKMQAAFQQYTDSAVSKTINMPHSATVEDIKRAYLLAWEEGCRGITIYRDGSRSVQVLNTAGTTEAALPSNLTETVVAQVLLPTEPTRRRLPDTRPAVVHKFTVGDQEGYLTAGEYDDGALGELFVVVSKQGSTVSGLVETVAQLISIARQYGVPLDVITAKLRGTRFEPAGPTGNTAIPLATSLTDYIARWLDQRYDHSAIPEARSTIAPARATGQGTQPATRDTGLTCPECGSLLFMQESCASCPSCGFSRCS